MPYEEAVYVNLLRNPHFEITTATLVHMTQLGKKLIKSSFRQDSTASCELALTPNQKTLQQSVDL